MEVATKAGFSVALNVNYITDKPQISHFLG